MSKTKEAVSDDETLTRVKGMILSRGRSKSVVDAIFTGAEAARKEAVKTTNRLFIQAPASQNQRPFMQKEAVAKNVTEFFEKRAYLSTAQCLFPELLKVGATDTQRVMPLSKKPAGATPVKPILSGDQQ